MGFAGKTAVVTGASMGIGRAVAEAFVREGASVAMLDVKQADPLPDAVFFRCDVGKSRDVDAAFDGIEKHFGRVDALVNNAGIQHYGTVTETSEQEWDRVLAVNLKSAFLCARRAIPLMLKDGGGGVVINVSSVQAFLSQNRVAPYTTSKTALLGLTRSIAVDYAPQIRCVAVCPGTVDTPMLHNAVKESPQPREVMEECLAMHPMKRIGTPQEIAELILFLASEKAGFITGQYVRIDGGLGISLGGSKRG